MNFAISSARTYGRKVLGPGRITSAIGRSPSSRQLLGAEQSEDDALLIDDNHGLLNPIAHSARSLVKTAGGHILPCKRTGARTVGVSAFGRHAGGHPVELAD